MTPYRLSPLPIGFSRFGNPNALTRSLTVWDDAVLMACCSIVTGGSLLSELRERIPVFAAEFHLERGQITIGPLDNHIDFQTIFVSVV